MVGNAKSFVGFYFIKYYGLINFAPLTFRSRRKTRRYQKITKIELQF